MKYKIILVNYSNNDVQPEFSALDEANLFTYDPFIHKRILNDWEKTKGWFALKKYGLHVFETDDLENFDLLKAQERKDEPYRQIHLELETNKYIDTAPMERKAEIKRIAEQLLIEIMNVRTDLADIKICVKIAKDFVDNFDAELERLENGN